MYNTDVVNAGARQLGRGVRRHQLLGQGDGVRQPDLHRRRGAVYLKATQPDLGITDPYELTQDQFDAAVDLLKTQHKQIGNYWVELHVARSRTSSRASS